MGMPTVVAVGAANSGTTGAVIYALPAGQAALDVFFLFVETNGAALTTPAGWGLVAATAVTTGLPTKLWCFWRLATASESSVTVAATTDHQSGRMVAIRGSSPSGNPWDVAPVAVENLSDTTVSIPGGTTIGPNRLILAAFSTGQDIASTANASGWTNASLGSVTEIMDNWVVDGDGGGFAVATGTLAVAGTYSATTATVGTANFKGLMSIAVREDPAGRIPTQLQRSPRPAEHMVVTGPHADHAGSSFIGG